MLRCSFLGDSMAVNRSASSRQRPVWQPPTCHRWLSGGRAEVAAGDTWSAERRPRPARRPAATAQAHLRQVPAPQAGACELGASSSGNPTTQPTSLIYLLLFCWCAASSKSKPASVRLLQFLCKSHGTTHKWVNSHSPNGLVSISISVKLSVSNFAAWIIQAIVV
jgi:hypothetical protein